MVEKAPERVMDVHIELGHGKFKMDDAFELRVKAIEIGKASEKLWEGLTPEHKEVLSQIFRRSLEVLHENTERYLANIITGAPGDMINIGVQILMSKVEEQVDIIQAANEFEREAVKRQMIADLIGEMEPLTDEEFLDHVKESLQHGIHIPNDAVARTIEILEAKAAS